MARRNLGRAPGIGKRWPYKALNFLPSNQLWKYLIWKSGGGAEAEPFLLGKSLGECRRLLIVLPEGFQENLLAFPVLQSIVQDSPTTEFLFLVEEALTGFLSALFGPERIKGVRAEEFYWGEPHFRELLRTLTAFRPDVSINLRGESLPLMHFLLRASRAAIRVQVSADAPTPFANVQLKPPDPDNHLRRFMQAARLWDFSPRPVALKWSRLNATAENLKDATARLAAKGLKPEATRLFLWQQGYAVQRDALQAAASERAGQGAATSLLIVNAGGSLYDSPQPLAEETLGLPTLQADTTGLLLGLFAQASKVIGVNGPLLHLAGLADADVEARFEASDAAWDTAFLNPRMKVIYRGEAEGRASGDPA